MVGVPFLRNATTFAATYPSAVLYVEWSPGADLTDIDGSGWTWTDISSDVLQANGKNISISPMGRSDAAQQGQPAGCSFTLDNRAANYSRGPQSVYYPNVKLNIPVRVSISLDGVYANKVTRFQGYIWSMRPQWDETGNYAVTAVQASGVSRRLQHGVPALRSPMYRAFTADTSVVAYWPMDDAEGSTSLVNGVAGGQPMGFNGLTLSNYAGVTGAGSIATYTSSGRISAPVSKSFASHWEVDFLIYVNAIPAADTAMLRIHTVGSEIGRWELVWQAASSTLIAVKGYDNSATLVVNDSANMGTTVGIPLSCRFMAQQNGTGTDYQFVVFPADFSTGGPVNTGTVALTTVGNITEISNLSATGMVDVSMGHVVVIDDYNHTFPDKAMLAYSQVGKTKELAYTRVNRLTTEEGVYLEPWSTNGDEYMGTQGQKSLMDLLREAEVADQGFLWDGRGPGLTWRGRYDLQNRSSIFTLSTTDLVPDFVPDDDDQDVVNKMTVTREGGSSATYQDTSGVLGTTAIGYYESTLSGLNVQQDDRLLDFASWLVRQGTVEGYRYPQVNLDMRRIPTKAAAWLTAAMGSRIDVLSIENWVNELPNGDIRLQVLGWSETLTNQTWEVALNCAPYAPWDSSLMDDSVGTYALYANYIDGDASTTSASALVNATSISVASTGYLWSTVAADKPIDLLVGGWKVTCSAISGSSSPQTFTVSALPAAVSSGAKVQLFQPTHYAL